MARIVCVMAAALLVAALAGCAGAPATSAHPRSPNQLKQGELAAMEKAGQRNDFDAPYAPKP